MHVLYWHRDSSDVLMYTRFLENILYDGMTVQRYTICNIMTDVNFSLQVAAWEVYKYYT